MILRIKHRGLKHYWLSGQTRGLNPAWVNKIDRILFALDQAAIPQDMDFPGYRLHPLQGKRAGFYAVDVSCNWRIVFRFSGTDTTDIDLLDYH